MRSINELAGDDDAHRFTLASDTLETVQLEAPAHPAQPSTQSGGSWSTEWVQVATGPRRLGDWGVEEREPASQSGAPEIAASLVAVRLPGLGYGEQPQR